MELFELSSGDWFVILNVVPKDPVSVQFTNSFIVVVRQYCFFYYQLQALHVVEFTQSKVMTVTLYLTNTHVLY